MFLALQKQTTYTPFRYRDNDTYIKSERSLRKLVLRNTVTLKSTIPGQNIILIKNKYYHEINALVFIFGYTRNK